MRARWDVVCQGKLMLKGGAFVGQDLIVYGAVECAKGVRVGKHLTGTESLRAGQGIVVGGAITRPAEITARFTGAINAMNK